MGNHFTNCYSVPIHDEYKESAERIEQLGNKIQRICQNRYENAISRYNLTCQKINDKKKLDTMPESLRKSVLTKTIIQKHKWKKEIQEALDLCSQSEMLNFKLFITLYDISMCNTLKEIGDEFHKMNKNLSPLSIIDELDLSSLENIESDMNNIWKELSNLSNTDGMNREIREEEYEQELNELIQNEENKDYIEMVEGEAPSHDMEYAHKTNHFEEMIKNDLIQLVSSENVGTQKRLANMSNGKVLVQNVC